MCFEERFWSDRARCGWDQYVQDGGRIRFAFERERIVWDMDQ